ncbi:MAG: ABC transporter permease [Clostridiales bacterium]|nr:ABC transporter permease [Clostridiales bacterium]MDD7432022.1 ABC transporter permease [Clostridiales bacterium]MDY3061007.1 ABC transporter permease [Eubacteriales bacterium]
MGRFALRRFFSGLLTVFVVFALNFVIIHAAPGNPVKSIIGKETSNPELTQALMDKWGLNDPLTVQFSRQLGNTLKGDLGTSILYNRPVNEMILERLGATLLLGVVTAVLSLLIGTALGVVCARKEGSWLDRILSVITYALDSMPSFWLGLMLIILLSSKLGLLPTQGMENVRAGYTGLRHVLDVLYHLILPSLTLVLISIPGYFRIAKSSIQQVTSEDFIITLRATGMSEKKIFSKYIFRNAILPTVTLFGITLAFLVTGVSLIEIVFSWPGMGRLTMTAINQRDYPVLMGIYFVMSVSVALVMVLVDIAYAMLDPRIRYDR